MSADDAFITTLASVASSSAPFAGSTRSRSRLAIRIAAIASSVTLVTAGAAYAAQHFSSHKDSVPPAAQTTSPTPEVEPSESPDVDATTPTPTVEPSESPDDDKTPGRTHEAEPSESPDDEADDRDSSDGADDESESTDHQSGDTEEQSSDTATKSPEPRQTTNEDSLEDPSEQGGDD